MVEEKLSVHKDLVLEISSSLSEYREPENR